MAVREDRETIVFLHRIVPGGADRSYGIHVASLAGVPEPVLARAKTLLEKLERGQLGPRDDAEGSSEQLDLFGEPLVSQASGPMTLSEEQIDRMSLAEAKAALRILSGVSRLPAGV